MLRPMSRPDAARGRITRRVVTLLLPLAAACGSFDTIVGADDDAGDAPSTPDASIDAPSPDGAAVDVGCDGDLCDSFESDGYHPRWTLSSLGDAGLEVTGERASDGSRSLRAAVIPQFSSTSRYLQLRRPGLFDVSFSLWIDSIPSNSESLTIAQRRDDVDQVRFVSVRLGARGLFLQVSQRDADGGRYDNDSAIALNVVVGQWLRVRFWEDAAMARLQVEGNGEAQELASSFARPPQTSSLRLGVVFAVRYDGGSPNNGEERRFWYDDVVVR